MLYLSVNSISKSDITVATAEIVILNIKLYANRKHPRLIIAAT
ncbi:hypothetical protein [Liquorilactobacillus satsumensis]